MHSGLYIRLLLICTFRFLRKRERPEYIAEYVVMNNLARIYPEFIPILSIPLKFDRKKDK